MKTVTKKILSFGSLNIDHVYQVEHLVRPGETIASNRYSRFAGGKGLNQSLAMARAGARVFHAGKIGADGLWLKQLLIDNGVDVSFVKVVKGPTGHAIIQVNCKGENAIVIHGGANQEIKASEVGHILKEFMPGDFLVIQNEISAVPAIIKQAASRGLQIFFNPTPMRPDVLNYPLRLVSYFIINEVEGAQLTGRRTPKEILEVMQEKFPQGSVILTLGERGACFSGPGKRIAIPAVRVKAVDTTAAGDTFIGYLAAEIAAGRDISTALKTACQAAAICVTRPGAADSIPFRRELPK